MMVGRKQQDEVLSITFVQQIHSATHNYILIQSINLQSPVEETFLINSLSPGL